MNKRYLALIAMVAAFALSFNALYAPVAGAQASQDKANESHPLTLEALEAQVFEKARQLALEPYQEPSEKAPDFLKGLTYDQWRDIRFKPEKALWRDEGLPFQLQFFHLGFYYEYPVKINVVTDQGIVQVPFSPELFDYGKNALPKEELEGLGFAGLRVHYPVNRPDYHDELIVFLGASYFRALGKNQRYGISARGLAVDTALPKGEEFPHFKEFWIVKPTPDAKSLTIYALLDSQSLTGAYKFFVQPGENTAVDVKAAVFRRKDVEKIGIAPLTSMFYYGENSRNRPDDYRPEVHDSDGLMIALGNGEWLWRPLNNPPRLTTSAFQAEKLAGFGLLQRDTNFDHYQDLEARYDLRPSVWISPREDWGEGHVELIEIPTIWETTDNIVAFWVPKSLPALGEPVSFSYRMSWYLPKGSPHGGGYVVATRTGKGKDEGVRRFVVDFEGGALNAIPADVGLTSVVTVTEGMEILEKILMRNEVTGGWRLVLEVRPAKGGPIEQLIPERRPRVEMRAFLKKGEDLPDVLTETWSYSYQP